MSALDALFQGLVFFGTGGGGRAETGLAMLRAQFGPDWTPRFASPDDLPPETLTAATIVIGGRDPEDDFSAEERRDLGLPESDVPMPDRFVAAIRALGDHLGRPVQALAVVELGSVATAATLIAADLLGLPVLDADCTGRSIPELGLTKTDLSGIAAAPLAAADRFGGQTLLAGPATSAMADRKARQLGRAVKGRGLAVAAYPAPLSRMRQGLVAGSLPLAAEIGAILCAPDPAEPRLAALLARLGGRRIAHAVIGETRWRSREPYAFREFDYHLAGLGGMAGRSLRVFVKNEHHAVWIDDALTASSPDVIALLDAETLLPLTTLGEAGDGREVFVVACPALDAAWRTPEGLALLGPRRFGLDLDPACLPAGPDGRSMPVGEIGSL